MQLQNSEHICCYSWAGRNADPSPDKQAVLLWAAEGAQQSATQIKIGSCQFPIYHSACRFLPLRKSLGSPNPKPLMTIFSCCLSKSPNVELRYKLNTVRKVDTILMMVFKRWLFFSCYCLFRSYQSAVLSFFPDYVTFPVSMVILSLPSVQC